MEAIVAVYTDWGIGNGSTQPVTLHADRVHFREMTQGAAMILGRRTLEDFPGKKPLKGRDHIVLSGRNLEVQGAELVHSVEEALKAAEKYDRCIVIGGASVYTEFYPYLDRVYVTKVGCCPESLKFFHNLDEDPEWVCTEKGPELEENGVPYCFCTYERKGE